MIVDTRFVPPSSQFTPIYKADDPYGIGLMLLGLFLVPFSQVLLWKNERKAVTFARLLTRAKNSCISANSAEPDEGNDLGLVHISGTTFNNINLCDRDFGVIA